MINDGPAGGATRVDFLLDYKPAQSFLVSEVTPEPGSTNPDMSVSPARAAVTRPNRSAPSEGVPPSALELEYQQQQRINTPDWSKWENKQIETSLGDVRQWENQVAVCYPVLIPTDHAVEIVPPQIQISGQSQQKKRKKKKGANITADQLEIRDFRLSTTRLEPGARADGVVVFDRPNYKQSSEKLFLQIAQVDKVDRPVLIRLPFTPPVAGDTR